MKQINKFGIIVSLMMILLVSSVSASSISFNINKYFLLYSDTDYEFTGSGLDFENDPFTFAYTYNEITPVSCPDYFSHLVSTFNLYNYTCMMTELSSNIGSHTLVVEGSDGGASDGKNIIVADRYVTEVFLPAPAGAGDEYIFDIGLSTLRFSGAVIDLDANHNTGSGFFYAEGEGVCEDGISGSNSWTVDNDNFICFEDNDVQYRIQNIDSTGNTLTFKFIDISNTAPVINSVSPSTTINLGAGDQQIYSASVIDNEADATYSWRLDGNEVATTTTYTAVANNLGTGTYDVSLYVDDGEFNDLSASSSLVILLNTEPVINSISPNTRVELTNGETQLYTSDVTDTDGDAVYSWTLDGNEVSTSDSYLAEWDNIDAGIYTLELTVSDDEYSNSLSTTLEIRARGGSSSGGSNDDVIDVINDVDISNNDIIEQNIFQNFWNWLRGSLIGKLFYLN